MYKNRTLLWIVIILIIVVLLAVIVYFFNAITYAANKIKLDNNSPVARRLTEDMYMRGPIEFMGDIYFPSSYSFPESRNTNALGTLAPKNHDELSKMTLYTLIIADKDDVDYTHLKTFGDDTTTFTKADFLENPERIYNIINEYDRFVLVNDEVNKSNRYSIGNDIINELENTFGKVRYYAEDFNNASKRYYIYVESPTNPVIGGSDRYIYDEPIVFIGLIYVNNGELYYGNMKNKIEGDLANRLTSIINSRDGSLD